MNRTPAGFLSYARLDDEFEEGYITQLKERIEKEVHLFTGDDFSIFQDRFDVRWGEEWSARIGRALRSTTFLIPILTPSFFKSRNCLQELQDFLELERQLERRDLILPIYYIECLVLERADRRANHPLAQTLATRQYVDWRDLRGASFREPRTRTRLATVARQIRDALDTQGTQEESPREEVSTPTSFASIGAETIRQPEVALQVERGGPFFYEDFIVQIARASDGDYILRVLRSPAGEGEDRIAGEYALQVIEEVNRALEKARWSGSVQEIEALGKRIYHLLMTPVVKSLFSGSVAHLGPKHGLRLALRLGLEDPTVAPFWSLPWEYIFWPERKSFLCLNRKYMMVRLLDLPLPSMPPVRVAPVRLLVVTGDHPAYGSLDLVQEISFIKRAFDSHTVQIEVLQDATLDSVRHALSQKEFHGIHYAGHGAFDENKGEGALLFRDRGGAPQSVLGRTLAASLRGFPSLRFAVLSASQSGKISSVNPLGGVAAALLRSGLSAVVAFQTDAADDEAIAFTKSFYQRLAAGNPIDVAVLEGRLAVAIRSPRSIGWGSPVLYTRVSDGRLF